MKTETKNSSKLVSRLIKTALTGAVGALVVYYGLLFIFGVKYLDSDYYGSYFYAWRVENADKQMLGMYKLVKRNEHPDTEDRRVFSNMVQSESSPHYIQSNYAEHFPRGFAHQFSLNFPTYKPFLEMRTKYIEGTDGLDTNVSYKDMTKSAKDRKDKDLRFFADNVGKISSIEAVQDMMFSDNNPWREASNILMKIVVNILGGAPGYKFDGQEVGDELSSDIKEMAKVLGMGEKVQAGHIDVDAFFLHNGKVSATPFETLAYSRMYYLFYFLTSTIDFEGVKKPADLSGDKQVQEYREKRMLYVAHLFARVVASVYPNKHTQGKKDVGFWKKVRNFYSPLRVVKRDPVLETDVATVKDAFSQQI